MAHDRMAVLAAMMQQGVIPVFHHPDAEVCFDVIRACADAGARCFEFTNRADFALRVFETVSRRLAVSDPSVILGAGSIVDAPTAALFIADGARFVVSPCLNAEIARLCNRRKIAYSPGCGSVSEISAAEELGCELIKLFPGASVGGPEFVRAVMGPMPWTRLMPTGGVELSEAALRAWFGAGVAAVGAGSGLIPNDLLKTKNYKGLTRHVRATLDLAQSIRAELADRPG